MRRLTHDQRAIYALFLLSFIFTVVGVEVRKVGAFPVRIVAIATAIALMPLTFAYLRKVYEVLDAVLTSSLAGILSGASIGFIGLYIAGGHSIALILGIKWLCLGAVFCIASFKTVRALNDPKEGSDEKEVDLSNMSEIERLRHFEIVFGEELGDVEPRKIRWNPMGLAFVGVSLFLFIFLMLEIDNSRDRWIYGGGYVLVIGLAIPLMLFLKKRMVAKVNNASRDLDKVRQHCLEEVRQRIASLEQADQPDSS